MAQVAEKVDESPETRRFWPRRKRWRALIVFSLLILGGILLGWVTRERIANNIIEEQLRQLDLPATYEIGAIGPDRQVLKNVVIGDPDNPDMTIESVAVLLRYRLGTPTIGRVELVKPRLYGTLRDGELSFGALDPLIFTESDEPAGLPDLDIKLVDGRALIESDYGPIGIKAEGEGELDSGFDGMLAAVAPDLAIGGCQASRTTAFGKLVTSGGEPRFAGPVRLRGLQCADGLALESFDAETDFRLDETLSAPSGEMRIAAQSFAFGESRIETLAGQMQIGSRDGQLNSRYTLEAGGIRTPQASLAKLQADGVLRVRDGFERIELDTSLAGSDLATGASISQNIAALEQSAEGTLAAPLLAKLRRGLDRGLPGSDLRAELTLRRTGEVISGAMPTASLRSANDQTLLALSQVDFSTAGTGALRIAGNVATGGEDLPVIRGRMERAPGGQLGLRLRMEEYRAGESAIALPGMVIAQSTTGAIGFSGELRAEGPLPGGSVDGLSMPISGNWAPTRGLSLWRECAEVRFDRLLLANLELDRRGLTVCPAGSGAIVSTTSGELRIAAGIPSLDLSGRLAETPIRLQSGAVGFAWPGAVTARNVDVALGPEGTASRFTISELDAQLEEEIRGTFSEADISLDAVPLDIVGANGEWAYRDQVLTLSEGAFRLLDREAEDRFEPLSARGAQLTLEDNVINAQADLRHPESDRLVTRVDIRHDLTTGTGFADLDVPELRFDDALQPDQLTVSLDGVIELAEGIVTGTGRIDWNEQEVTSTGRFSTDNLDFAAAFGPVKGASGTVVFDDLLSLTTAPGQTLKVASINPGIEVNDGEVSFALEDGQLLTVTGGRWPFMGGELILRPVKLNFGVEEQRLYLFEIVGLDAGVFVERLELGNLAARGTFDGTIPIVFDAQGDGSIAQGLLISRPPGGNLSYVGELTYEDLSPIANYAFGALRSLDFNQMRVEMEGPLTGEIITRLRFDGVKQGEEADSNFVTKRLSKLPLQFRVNIRADFFKLITSMKSLYDPASVRDPRELGLLSDDGTRLLRREITGEEAEADIDPEDVIPDEPAIQDQESENMP
ncbi:Dicarboxylate transport [Altererythrobacter xiamenensis]|uniref:Dicarboxylate transport n=1 Tax=Altererythrobacter xiamenensis TaxID=1316679 RepID=A0A1Y6E4U7_9SPHN|nr:YdbH domain-containing protein [Altererythrobacter xiamenensis]SMQ57797.1 Dicarboxylate transport [Altererythrobacter xiamenensis]